MSPNIFEQFYSKYGERGFTLQQIEVILDQNKFQSCNYGRIYYWAAKKGLAINLKKEGFKLRIDDVRYLVKRSSLDELMERLGVPLSALEIETTAVDLGLLSRR